MNRHQVVVLGGGTAGITVAARLRRTGVTDIALIEPSTTHYYQPLWTLVGGGRASAAETARPQHRVIPRGVRWYPEAAQAIDPDRRHVELARTGLVGYQHLVVATGLRLDYEAVPGLTDTLGHDGVSTNYAYHLAPKTWEFIRGLRSGTALFTMPTGPVKCGGAPQKIAYLAADHWRRQAVLDQIRVVLVLPTPTMFKVDRYAQVLRKVADRYGIEVRLSSELIKIDSASREAVVADLATGNAETLAYDMMHVTPPQHAPDWIRSGPLADPDDPAGCVRVDPHTLRHPTYPEIFALGDVANLPTSKTGAAVRHQAPVLVDHLLADRAGRTSDRRYDGYTSCPLVTARNRMLLAEFDYTNEPTPTIPLIDTARERYDMWLLKRYGLPWLYWHGMLRGLA
ncbi:NAD(P)/FAD-dependent oxidoreductase [Solwaraspora sp. WMMB335]|uniref:NAD(P)/FAD-dependent oxidoreductase n=1 Tax=Solwaraspora sp. WMMB335 TaxID=3404118 RepID=UPI003B92DEDA